MGSATPRLYSSSELSLGSPFPIFAPSALTKVLEMTKEEGQALYKDYENWNGSVHTVKDAVDTMKVGEVKRLFIRALGEDAYNQQLSDSPIGPYLREFSEWFADSTAKWLVNKPEPKTIVERFFLKCQRGRVF